MGISLGLEESRESAKSPTYCFSSKITNICRPKISEDETDDDHEFSDSSDHIDYIAVDYNIKKKKKKKKMKQIKDDEMKSKTNKSNKQSNTNLNEENKNAENEATEGSHNMFVMDDKTMQLLSNVPKMELIPPDMTVMDNNNTVHNELTVVDDDNETPALPVQPPTQSLSQSPRPTKILSAQHVQQQALPLTVQEPQQKPSMHGNIINEDNNDTDDDEEESDDDDESESSGSTSELPIEDRQEIETRKSMQSQLIPPKQANLMRPETITPWKSMEINEMESEMKKQLESLNKQDEDEHNWISDGVHDDDDGNDSNQLTVKEVNLIRTNTATPWPDEKLATMQHEMSKQIESIRQISQSKNLTDIKSPTNENNN